MARARKGAAAPRRVSLRFESLDAFAEQYVQNLSKGGAFVTTDEAFGMREIVQVQLDLVFIGELIPLDAEVVHCLDADTAPPGVDPGIAVQFLSPANVLRERLAPYANGETVAPADLSDDDPPTTALDEDGNTVHSDDELDRSAFDPGVLDLSGPADGDDAIAEEEDLPELSLEEEGFDLSACDLDDLSGGKSEAMTDFTQWLEAIGDPGTVGEPVRGASMLDENDRTFTEREDREPVRIPAAVKSATGVSLRGRTRNLSRSGVLLSIDGEQLAEGREVHIALIHPRTGEALTIPGKVARRLAGEGAICAVAIALQPGAEIRERFGEFVDEIHEIERGYRERGIRGPLQELGAVSLLQMFPALAPRGTLTVSAGMEEGTIAFEGSQLLLAEVGSVVGPKALARILSWREGHFEFRAHLDTITADRSPKSLERSIEEALLLVEEAGRHDGPALSADQRFVVDHDKLSNLSMPLNKSEEAVLELAAAGFTLRRILDVIPDNDAQVRAAVVSLGKRGLLRAEV